MLQRVPLLNELFGGVIIGLVDLGIPDHLFDLIFRQAILVVGDDDVLTDSFGLLNSRDGHDSVGVNLEGDLNLWGSTWSWRDTFEGELSQLVVVLGQGSLTLEDLDVHTWLVVRVGGEDLRLLGGDVGLPWDQGRHDLTSGLNTQRQWDSIDDQ